MIFICRQSKSEELKVSCTFLSRYWHAEMQATRAGVRENNERDTERLECKCYSAKSLRDVARVTTTNSGSR